MTIRSHPERRWHDPEWVARWERGWRNAAAFTLLAALLAALVLLAARADRSPPPRPPTVVPAGVK